MQADRLLEAADELASSRGIRIWRALMLVLLDELSHLRMPMGVAPALSTARLHWTRDEQATDQLLEAKLMCWSYLDELAPPDLAHSSGRRVRALLCVLEPDGDEEAASRTAEWFVDMLVGVPG